MKTRVCECCGAQYGIHDALRRIPMGPIPTAMTRILADSAGQWIPTERLVDTVHASSPDGGPETAANGLRVAATRLRPRLKAAGLELLGRQHNGYMLRWAK